MWESMREGVAAIPWLGEIFSQLARLPSEQLMLAVTAFVVLVVGWTMRYALMRRLRASRASGEGFAARTRATMSAAMQGLTERVSLPPAPWSTTGAQREDLSFMSDTEAALRDAPSRTSSYFLAACAGLLFVGVSWAYFAELEEVTRGDGRVIPSSRTQVVQSLEGGIIKSIEIREGDTVRQGQVLLHIDDTGFSASLGELAAKELALRAQTERLRVEAADGQIDTVAFSPDLKMRAPEVVANEQVLFKIRHSGLHNQLNVLRERLTQRRQELAELHENRKRFASSLDIARREFELKEPLAKRGIVPMPDILRLEREMTDLKGQLASTEQSIPRVEAAIREAEGLLEEQRLTFRQTAQGELNAKLAELIVVRESLRSAQDKVTRTEIRSPVDGVVNKLHVNTIGGVVRASEPMVEITPLEDALQIEVQVRPSDIAFIRPGQQALVKISAYDFTIFGGLNGKVELISSDSIIDESTKEAFYLVTVRTEESSLQKGNEFLPIIPGMVASVDIITGEKSVLDYILKPIVKARHEALRER